MVNSSVKYKKELVERLIKERIWKHAMDLFKKHPSTWWGDKLDVRFLLLSKIIGLENKKVLELAGGEGIITTFIPRSNDILSVEIECGKVKTAKMLNKDIEESIVCKDMFEVDEKGFDVVIMAHCIPKNDITSSKEPEEGIKLARKLLKGGGSLIITTVNANNPYYKGRKPLNYEKVVEMVKQAGFHISAAFTWNPIIYFTHITLNESIAHTLFRLLSSWEGNSGVGIYIEAINGK